MDVVLKRCTKCLETKTLNEFPKNRSIKSGYYSTCKICTNRINKELVDKRKVLDPEYEHKRYLKCLEKNPRKYRELRKIRTKKWIENNIERNRLQKRLSQAKRKSKQKIHISVDEINKLIQDSKNICFWCNCNIPEGKTQLDHLYPLSKSGEHVIANLVVSCKPCNRKKWNRDPMEFLKEVLQERVA